MKIQNDGAEVIMELTTEMERTLIPFFNIELEVIQGSRELLPDGRIRIACQINDPDKYNLVREFVLKCISKSHIANQN